jgi:PAS domain S-box-containing protein
MSSTLHRTFAPARPAPAPSPAPPPAALVARFRYAPGTDAWWWSPEMHALHGVPAGAAPRARVLLDLLHPADRHRTRIALAACAEGRPFSLETRVTRPDGGLRSVVLAATPVLDPAGRVAAVEGVCVDVTDARHGTPTDRVQELECEVAQLRTAMAGRAPIEQAKGILMLLTGCGEQPAFDLLAHISSHTHRKVRDVAVALVGSASGQARLPEDIAGILHDACPPPGPH